MDATDLKDLPDDVATLKRMLIEREALAVEQQAFIAQLQREKEGLSHHVALLLQRIYGRGSERIDARQLLLFGQAMSQTPAPAPGAAPGAELPEEAAAEHKATSKRKGHGRRPLPQDLPRHRVEHPIDPAELTCPCCGEQRHRIGEVVSEQLEYVPASLFVVEHVRGKYACKRCEEGGVATAERSGEGQVIEKGLPGPGLVAQIAVSKFSEHLPLYRLERIFARHGVTIARSTMCGWMREAANLLNPLYELMCERIRQSRVIHTDDTPLPVQDPRSGRGRTKTGRLWVYLGDPRHPYTIYEYTPSRSRDGPAAWLKGYEGYLQADAFGGYDGIYATGKVTEVACTAHARRKFHDARLSDPARALHVLARIRLLYDIEKQAKDCQPAERAAMRQTRSRPILAELHDWLLAQRDGAPGVLPKSPLGQAIQYALNHWQALVRYTDDGDLAIDNNAAERAIRPVTVGRRNYLFAGSDAGGRTAAVLYSLIISAQRHGIDPFAYLRDVLCRLDSTPRSRIEQLLPDHWKRGVASQPAN